MAKILGLDLGTNSIGVAVRNEDLGENLKDQLEYFTVLRFAKGVGEEKNKEYSLAAERTEHRSSRVNKRARRYRIWNTLELLIENDMCPLGLAELDRWRKYDKSATPHRKYPVDHVEFQQWIKLDFDGDDVPDYDNPYQIRAELIERQFDFSKSIDRHKFGRAIFHIAQRRGFRSSKGETIADSKKELDLDSLKKSEEKKSQGITDYMDENNFVTVGQAFADLIDKGLRVRNSEYEAVRSQYLDELINICDFQGVDRSSKFYKRLISTKKGEGTVFYQRPLRSQKGAVGYCTLEPDKKRCPSSHPDFEFFRAYSFINNIKYRKECGNDWQTLSEELRDALFDEKFMRVGNSFKFEDIRKWIEKKVGFRLSYEGKTINYRDYTNIAGCPVSARLRKIMGDDWRTKVIQTDKFRTNKKTGETHRITYIYEDLWHLAFTYDDQEALEDIAKTSINLDDDGCKNLIRLWLGIVQGYGMLSLKAIRNINPFLKAGYRYSDAVFLAKIPELAGSKWEHRGGEIASALDNLSDIVENERLKYRIVNNLISRYKTLPYEDQFAYKNFDYQLTDDDLRDVEKSICDTISEVKYKVLADEDRQIILKDVTNLYQEFFADKKRNYFKLPKVEDMFKHYLLDEGIVNDNSMLDKLYHPSEIDLYPIAPEQFVERGDESFKVRLLQSPAIDSIRNPMAMRVLHMLRRQINAMLCRGVIDEDTRVVVETARELTDANMRAAIRKYNKKRQNDNEDYKKKIRDLKGDKNAVVTDDELLRYRLWTEQNGISIYTGETINLADLFNGNMIDIEHTMPRSISFDDSQANKTVCESHFNRKIKGNRFPSELSSHEDILVRIQPWIENVEKHLKEMKENSFKAKYAMTKSSKDNYIQNKHVAAMNLDYWRQKVRTFTISPEEVTDGFRHSQLVDTGIITKYAFHYLKSVFERVDVQKGSVTSIFRMLAGLQNEYEKKNRDRHSHHAVDAAVLSVIPKDARRDRMIELYYTLKENKYNKADRPMELVQRELDSLIAECGFGSVNRLVDFIDSHILINHVSNDQTLTPAKKFMRSRGRIVRDESGKPIVQTGDCIRGRLHKETYYGAVKSNDGKMNMVVRKLIQDLLFIDKKKKYSEKDFRNFDNDNDKLLSEIVDPAIRMSIINSVKSRLESGMSYDDALSNPIYMLDKNGNEITTDKNGRVLAPIRHVRCRAKAGRGYLTFEKALKIKPQTYISKNEYKNYYYAQNDTNYLCLLYESEPDKKGNIKRQFDFVNLFEIAGLKSHFGTDVDEVLCETKEKIVCQKTTYKLAAVLKIGTRVLMWNECPEELYELDKSVLYNRMYVLYKFNESSSNYAYLRKHIIAETSEKEQNDFDLEKDFSLLKLVADKFNCLIEGRDFEIDELGEVIFKH